MWGINSPSSLPPSPPLLEEGAAPPGRLHHLPRVQLLQQPEQGGRLMDPAELYAEGLHLYEELLHVADKLPAMWLCNQYNP